MTKNEYSLIKNYSYKDYCDYLNNKYDNYNKEGLFKHHFYENEKANLSNPEIAKYATKEERETIVYCNYLEHLLLHIMIGEQTDPRKRLGLGGAITYIIPDIENYYNSNIKKYKDSYYNCLIDNKELFDILVARCNQAVEKLQIVLESNISLYKEVEYNLNVNHKALVVLGTGLGKTTTALEYLKNNKCRALVIGPNNIIKTGWEEYSDWCDTTTYQSFANKYKDIDYSQYGLVILDEVHHIGYDENTDTGAKVWSKGIHYILDQGIKVLGLTATPERSDSINVGQTIFKDCVCEGKSIEDAIEQGIIYPFSYITALYDTDGIIEECRKCDNKELVGQLDIALNNTPKLKTILQNRMPAGKRKGIVFIQDIADEDNIKDILKDAFPNIPCKAIHSRMTDEEIKNNRAWFENTDEGFLLAVNMISEGTHYNGVNTLIMFRKTNSYLVFTQQLGRIVTLVKNENPNAIVFDLVNNIDNIEYHNVKLDQKTHSIGKIVKVLEKTEAFKSEQIIVAEEGRNIVKAIRNIKNYEDDSWQDWEIDIIQNKYFDIGPCGVAQLLEVHGRHRTSSSIRCKANKMGIFCQFSAVYKIDPDTLNIVKYYPTISSVEKDGYSRSGVGQCVQRKMQKSSGYYWVYVTDWNEEWKPVEVTFARNKKIYCFETNMIYSNASEASLKTGANKGKILRCCRKKENTASGLHFCYPEDKGAYELKEGTKKGIGYSLEENEILNKFYPTLGLSSKLLAMLPGRSKESVRQQAHRLSLKYNGSNKHEIKVLCVELNKVFGSMKEAAAFINIQGSSSITHACKGEHKTAGGYHWKYIEEGENKKDGK